MIEPLFQHVLILVEDSLEIMHYAIFENDSGRPKCLVGKFPAEMRSG